MFTRRSFLAGTATVAGLAQNQAQLQLEITDKETGKTVPARVLLRDGKGRDHIPPGAVEVPIGPDRWFVASGFDQLPLPAGEYHLRVERGTEYLPVKRTIPVPEGRSELSVQLERWVNMRTRGYLSGENHLHVPAKHLPAILTAEDLDFGTSLYWWNGPDLEHPGLGAAVREMRFGGASTVASVFDAELEYAWGAVYLLGISRPLETPSDRGRANWAYIAEARKLGGLVCYQGGWSREVLVDALLGFVDVVNICNNNFHRYKFQPRSLYSNLLQVDGFPVYPNTPEGMLEMNTGTYYRLLNCGLRLAAGAGSATGVKSSPVGYNRCYIPAGDGLTLPQFLSRWREGKNFVTNGPMVFLSADGRSGPGDTLRIPAGGRRLNLTATAIAAEPLRSLEIVANGKAAARADIPPGSRQATLEFSTNLEESTWIAARATEKDGFLDDSELEPYLRRSGSNNPTTRESPCRLRFGHTSPIYAVVDGKPVRVAESVVEARKTLAAFELFARKTASDDHRAEILDRLAEARTRL